MRYNHLFFDLDHTLWDFEKNARETISELYALNDLRSKGIESFEAFYTRYSFHNERLWERYTRGYIKQEELRWKRMWLALLDFKVANEPLARNLAAEFLERLPYRKNLFLYAAEILAYLKDRGYKLHLLTNGFDRIQRYKLQNTQLHGYFDEIITSEASNSLKPQKEIFEFAIRKCQTCREECIMIGDNLDADIKGAMNVGIDTVFVNHTGVTTDIRATYTVYHLKELEQIF